MTDDSTANNQVATGKALDRAFGCYRNGQVREAEGLCNKLLAEYPDHPETKHLLGVIALQKGEPDKAVCLIRDAIGFRPHNAIFHYNLGIAYHAQGDLDQAGVSLRRALEIQPDQAGVYRSLGALYQQQGDTDNAITHYRHAVSLEPADTQSLFALAILYHRQGNLQTAHEVYRQLLELEPGNAGALNGLGAVCHDAGDLEQAAGCYRRAIASSPGFVDAYNNLGTVAQQLGRTEEAIDSHRQALDLVPDNPVWRLRIASLCPIVAASNDEIDRYRTGLMAELSRCNEQGFSAKPEELVLAGLYPSYSLMYHGRDDRPVREAYARVFNPCFPSQECPVLTGRGRIGFVVTRAHEGIFVRSLGGVLQHLEPAGFELVILCATDGVEKIRSRMSCRHVQVMAMPDGIAQIAEFVLHLQIDILYYWEIATDPLNYFLPYYRLAPVQCTSWGIQVTSGIPNVDYYLSSRLVESGEADSHYTESLLRATTLLTYQYRLELPAHPKRRQDFGLRSDRNLYLFPQQIGKFHPDFDAMVEKILIRDPQGVLVVLEDKWGYATKKLRARLARLSTNATDRIVYLPRLSHQDYLCLIAVSDVLLDPPHYGGVNSSYDGFSLNKPIVTCESPYNIGRYTAACYRKMGLLDCVAADEDDYVDIAISLGTGPEYRAALCERLAEATSLLFDDMEAVHEHERLFTELLVNAGG